MTHKVIGDKRSKILENRAKKRAMEFKKMNKEDYDEFCQETDSWLYGPDLDALFKNVKI